MGLGRVLLLLIVCVAFVTAPVRAAMPEHAHMAMQAAVLAHGGDHGHSAHHVHGSAATDTADPCSDDAGAHPTETSHAAQGGCCPAWCAVTALPAVFSSLNAPESQRTREPVENITGPTGTLAPPIRPPRA